MLLFLFFGPGHDLRTDQIDINGFPFGGRIQKDLKAALSGLHALIRIGHFQIGPHGCLDANNGIVVIILHVGNVRVFDIEEFGRILDALGHK